MVERPNWVDDEPWTIALLFAGPARFCSSDPGERVEEPTKSGKKRVTAIKHGRPSAAKSGSAPAADAQAGRIPALKRRLCPGRIARALRVSSSGLPDEVKPGEMRWNCVASIPAPRRKSRQSPKNPARRNVGRNACHQHQGRRHPPAPNRLGKAWRAHDRLRRPPRPPCDRSGLQEIDVLGKDPGEDDHMRAISENVVRAPMATVDLWRAIESLASENWTQEAIAAALAIPVRQIRKLRLLATVPPAVVNAGARSSQRRRAGGRKRKSRQTRLRKRRLDLHRQPARKHDSGIGMGSRHCARAYSKADARLRKPRRRQFPPRGGPVRRSPKDIFPDMKPPSKRGLDRSRARRERERMRPISSQ